MKVSGFLTGKDLGLPVKLVAYKTFVRPIMEYGLALLKPTKSHLKNLQQIQHAASRMLPWVTRNTSHLVVEGLLALELMATQPASSAPTTGHSSAPRTSPSWLPLRRAPSCIGVWRSPKSPSS